MRRIIAAAAVVASVAGGGTAASAEPPGPAELKQVLLTEAEVPAGYALFTGVPEENSLSYHLVGTFCDDDPEVSEGQETAVVQRAFREADGTVVGTGVAGPGRDLALAYVTAIADTPTACPEVEDEDGGVQTFTRLDLPDLGAATGAALLRGEGTTRVRIAAVAAGDLSAIFIQHEDDAQGAEDTDDTEDFVAFVAAGARRLTADTPKLAAGTPKPTADAPRLTADAPEPATGAPEAPELQFSAA